MWYQLILFSKGQHDPEQLSDQLSELGALSVTFMDNQDAPVLEPLPGTTPLWPETNVTALFNDEALRDLAVLHLAHLYPELTIEQNAFADEAWERAWMDDFKPMCFGQRLWVCPSNHQPPKPDACNILLDPGLAFGTGTHATTALCLRYLDNTQLEGRQVADFGCGSGILAIAALKLGAKHVYATDIDPQALEASIDNAKRNHIDESRLSLSLAEEFTCPPLDLLMANILAEPLISLAPLFYQSLADEGRIILSGIIDEQVESVKAAYQQQGFELAQQQTDKEWQLLELIKPKK